MQILCLDLEGVLVPELWLEISKATGVKEIGLTTRDIPDYDELMKLRRGAMNQHAIGYQQIKDALADVAPFDGAEDFLNWARSQFQVAILSDTFYELAMPLMQKLGYPFLLCHHLIVEQDRIVGYHRRQSDPKTKVVQALRSLELTVYASGDSYNDVGMLQTADCGFFFNPPLHVVQDHPDIAVVHNYDELRVSLQEVAVA